MGEIAIDINNISKNFRLPDEKLTSIKSHIVHPFKRRGYKAQNALKDITIEVKKGEFFGIVGRNGSGKSTLLKIMAGIYQPTKGDITVSGKLVPFIELGVGFNPELTGKDNVYLNGALLGFSQKEIDAQYDDIVEFAELRPFMGQKLKNYSSGMQVRLAFSMATRAKADILLIDEVLAVGDADFQRKCFEYFKSLKKEQTTVVFVSHDMEAVREFCDRAVLIEKSKIVASGDTSKVADKYSELFIEDSIESNMASTNSGTDAREGTGAVRAKTIVTDKSVYSDKDTKVRLSITLDSFGKNQDLMVGFRLRSATGQILQDSNTWRERIKLPELQVGKKCTVSWEFANIYSDGQYAVDVYVHGRGNVIFDIWNSALTFNVKRLKHSGAVVSPLYKITLQA